MVRAEEGAAVPVLLFARPPVDAAEERTIRKLAGARHAPGDWIRRARMIARSWDGRRTTQIADQLGCHPQTVRERLHRFNAEGVDGLGDRPGPGRPRRLTEAPGAGGEHRPGVLAGASQPSTVSGGEVAVDLDDVEGGADGGGDVGVGGGGPPAGGVGEVAGG